MENCQHAWIIQPMQRECFRCGRREVEVRADLGPYAQNASFVWVEDPAGPAPISQLTKQNQSRLHEVWFCLYDGTSPDGRGPGRYVGRTTEAPVRWLAERENDPHWCGSVRWFTDIRTGVATRVEALTGVLRG